MKWIIVSKDTDTKDFYPIHLFKKHLNNVSLTYKDAKEKPISFWKGQNVIFHMVWAGEHPLIWRKFYKNIAKVTKNFWIEFDCDLHVNNIKALDKASWGGHLFLYNEMAKVSNQFIWELPMDYNPFLIDVQRVQLGVYEKSWEKTLVEKRPVDFLALIDVLNNNSVQTIRLLEILRKNKYKVKCMTSSKGQYNFWKKRELLTELIPNTKFSKKSTPTFHKYLNQAKVFIDLTTRLTAGRVVYESLFNGAIPVTSTSYGATELISPEYGVDTFKFNMVDVYSKCLKAHNNWSSQYISSMRNNAYRKASIEKCIKELERASK